MISARQTGVLHSLPSEFISRWMMLLALAVRILLSGALEITLFITYTRRCTSRTVCRKTHDPVLRKNGARKSVYCLSRPDSLCTQSLSAEYPAFFEVLSQLQFSTLFLTKRKQMISVKSNTYVLLAFSTYFQSYRLFSVKSPFCIIMSKGGGAMKEKHAQRYQQFGQRIAYYRRLRGMTQATLAEKIDKATAFIGQVESPNVKKTISIDTLFDIADALDVPPKRFFEFDDDLKF